MSCVREGKVDLYSGAALFLLIKTNILKLYFTNLCSSIILRTVYELGAGISFLKQVREILLDLSLVEKILRE